MRLLALDTSTRYASIALVTESDDIGEQGQYGEYTWHTGNNHNAELLEYMQRLLDESGVTFQDLDAICVATGPGSFNGVRVAVATAKALAFTLQRPLLGISTLDVIASQQRQSPYLLCAVLEAGRGDLYAAYYRFEPVIHEHGVLESVLVRQGEYLLFSPEQVAEQSHALLRSNEQYVLFCGEMSDASYQALRATLPTQSLFMSRSQSMRHASMLAELGRQRLQRGETDDPMLLEPLYLRRPSITTSTRKRPLLGHTQSQQPQQPHVVQLEREEGALHH